MLCIQQCVDTVRVVVCPFCPWQRYVSAHNRVRMVEEDVRQHKKAAAELKKKHANLQQEVSTLNARSCVSMTDVHRSGWCVVFLPL